ncbi:MAG: hypothetical protein ACHQIL_00050 [Steroidobacterales bacterium]
MKSLRPEGLAASAAGVVLGCVLAWVYVDLALAAEQPTQTPVPAREIMAPGAAMPVRHAPGGNPAATAPTITQIEPNQLTPGQTYALAMSGTNLQPSMQISLGQGIVMQGALTVPNANHAQISVQVLPGTPAGRRLINVSYTPLSTLTALPAVKTQGPGYVDIVMNVASGRVALDEIMPREVQQGQQAMLTLLGSGFSSGMAVSFGPGISASGPVQVQSPTKATLSIQVSAQAPTMQRIATLLVAGKDSHVSPEATLTVTAGAPSVAPVQHPGPVQRPGPAPVAVETASVPMILAVSPSRLFTGQSYTLTLRGMNLVPQMQIDLGSGIKPAGGLRIQSASLATLDVTVQDGAPPGIRWVGLQLPSALIPVREDASVLVQRTAAQPSHGFGPRPGDCKAPAAPHQGTIVLDGPLYVGVSGDYGSTFNVPVLNDQTTLTWHEANIGIADRVEVRFFSGKTLIATRSISAAPGYALPHSLSPDDGLIAELTGKVGARATKIVNQNLGPGVPAPTVGWDLTWQVVGFKTVYDSCISPAATLANGVLVSRNNLGTGKEFIVEQSESVPITQPKSGDPLLDLTAAPTGLACGGPAAIGAPRRLRAGAGSGAPPPPPPASGTNLLLSNTSRVSLRGGRTATADYVGDKWQISGQMDLSDSPWAIESQNSVNTKNPSYPIETEAMNNVFVDWGDGTVEPLTIQWQGQYCGNQACFASNTETSTATAFNLDAATNFSAFGHAYGEVGSFDVRVYMLPAASVQQQGALPVSVNAGGGGLYGRLLSRTGQLNSVSTGNLGYMLLCQTVQIQHRTDPVSNGPLQLVDIHITGFPDDAASGSAGGIRALKAGAQRTRAEASVSGISGTAHVSGAAPVAAALPRAGVARSPGAGGGSTGSIPQFSSCDLNLVGGASIDYLGQGTVKLTWFQDGQPVGTSEEPIDPSPSRSDAQLAPPNPAKPVPGTWGGLNSPPLGLAQQQIGQHQIMVEAEVVADAHPIGRAIETLKDFAGAGVAATQGLHGGALANAPPLGLLGPQGAAAARMPPIAWVNGTPAGAPGLSLHVGAAERLAGGAASPVSNPPNVVVSAPVAYAVTSADPSLPCTFNFPVSGGKFVLAGLQHGGKATVQQQNGLYSGSGVLQTAFADASGTSTQPEPVTIHFNGWTMQADGVTVAKGTFSENPTPAPMHVPGANATLVQIAGSAGDKVTAALSASLANTDISAAGGHPPAPWKNISSTLSPKGDWYADQLPMPTLLVYDSGFTLSAGTATLDLSQAEGGGADTSCQGSSGSNWMGVLFNQATLTAFNLDLPNPPSAPAAGWALDGSGFCGRTNFPAGSARIDRGMLAWNGIAASASQGSFSASYNGLKVHVPWLNVDLTSSQATTLLTAGHNAGQGGINLNLTSPSKVTLTEGPMTLTASNLSFASVPSAGGWAVKSDTTVSFASQKGQFASGIALNGLDFGMNGAASFADGTRSRHLSLAGQKGSIGGSLVDLKSVDVEVGAASTTNRLAFAFDSTLNLSKTLPAADVAVSYAIAEPSMDSYQGSGPVTAPFKLDKPFPDANPSVHLSMTPTYVGGASGGGSSGSGVLFSSSLDLGMFGGPPISGQFVLGYVGSDDYWLAKAVLDLGPTGVQIVPPIINLYQIGGGMGYNVTLDSFKNSDLTQATPQDDGTLLFDATLLIGSPDHTTFGLSGDFVIKPGGQDPGGRMDYHAWLLDPNWTGQSPIYGYFSYSGGVFDGTLNAQFSVLNDQVALDATHDAIHMHVGGGQWYYHFGTQNNPLNGHLFFYNGQAWADIGSDGLGLGLKTRLDVDAGDCGNACAYIHDDWTVTASITPSPLAFQANAGQNFSLGACADGFCVGANASANVSLGLPPPYLNFSFGIGGCPPGQINVGLQVLPSLNPNVGGNVCL